MQLVAIKVGAGSEISRAFLCNVEGRSTMFFNLALRTAALFALTAQVIQMDDVGQDCPDAFEVRHFCPNYFVGTPFVQIMIY